MDNDLSVQAGNMASGKEEDRQPEELSLSARRARLNRKLKEQAGTQTAVKEETATGEEHYTDVLLRFGIEI